MLLSGVTVAQVTSMRFPDVQTGAYFASAVDRLSRKGIIKGYDDGRFAPFDYVTRGQVAVMLDRYDQTSVIHMRQQIEQIRFELGFGICGDGTAQVGEDCDDGNMTGGDGCSADCITELHCAGGYKVGESFTAPDGCNICTCTQAGVACTERTCSQKKCFATSECAQSEICSVEQGDCRYPCPKGAVCIQACAGVCIPKPLNVICGNGVCENGESAYPSPGSASLYCPQDCKQQGPVCGNAVCETGEADQYGVQCPQDNPNCSTQPVLIRRGSCTEDCVGGLTSCQERRNSIDALFAKSMECQTDADCTVFVRGCSPYQTCGKAARRDAILQITSLILDYSDSCANEEPTQCLGCIPKKASCVENRCTLSDVSP